MHSQGSYTDEEYMNIIKDKYEEYYNDALSNLNSGEYKNLDNFFINLRNSYRINRYKSMSDIYYILALVILILSLLIPQLLIYFKTIRSDINSNILEGLNQKSLKLYLFKIIDIPIVLTLLIYFVIMLSLNVINNISLLTLYSPINYLIIGILIEIIFILLRKFLIKNNNNK